ncbi:MAG: SGNH/GDSL hydrolase family protein, partial [Lachnospiraceae bacterium]|nr:SGNH/GDSL hydrolase family protein [Lachnospiraceae bacterium]
ESYSEMLEMIKEKLPDAVIFTVSNMRISKKAEKDDKTGVYKNLNINDKNTAISELADGERVFYFDINAPFVDKEGYLIDEYTFDGFHVYAKQYTEMADIFKAHGIKN